jgi:hypothetical protein
MAASKDLRKMTPKKLGQLFTIIIQEHSEEWADLYDIEKIKL